MARKTSRATLLRHSVTLASSFLDNMMQLNRWKYRIESKKEVSFARCLYQVPFCLKLAALCYISRY